MRIDSQPDVPARSRIVFFTGLGSDARLIEPQRALDADVEFQSWIEPAPDETLASFAQRLALQIDDSRPFYLAGISLGGMIALEVARHVNARGIVLISSCRSSRGVPLPYRIPGRAGRLSPLWLIRCAKRVMPPVRRLFGIVDTKQMELFQAMLGDADPTFIRWSLEALLTWPGPPQPPTVPIFHVHGRRDRILPLRLAGPVDHIVEGAGHVMNVSHAAEVNAAIAAWLAKREATQSVGSLARPQSVAT